MEQRQSDDLLIKQYKFEKEGQCVFVQRWCEMFNIHTIGTYQYKLRNVHSILNEILNVIDEVKKNSKISSQNLIDLTSECRELIENDKFLIKKYAPRLLDTMLSGIKLKKVDKSDLLNLEYRVRYSYNTISTFYFDKLLDYLYEAINDNQVSEIISLTEALGTEMINLRWSPRSLARLVKLIFISKNKFRRRSFDYKWNYFVEQVKSERKMFHCFFKLDSKLNKSRAIIQSSGFDILLGTDILAQHKAISDVHIDVDSYYITEESLSYTQDSHSAVEECLNKITSKQSILSFYGIELNNFDNTLILFPYEKKIVSYDIREYKINTNLKIDPNAQEKISNTLSIIYDHEIDKTSRQRINNFFRQYSLSIESLSPETAFTNLWFAIESLLVTGQYESNIEHVKKIVSSILCNNYVEDLLMNLLSDCFRAGVSPHYKQILIDTTDPKKVDIRNMLKTLIDEQERDKLLQQSNCHSLLKYRINDLSNKLAGSYNLNKLLSGHFKNLTWHIQRIYRLRNNLVHAAQNEMDISILIKHLNFYIRKIVMEIGKEFHKQRFFSLGDFFMSAEDNYYSKIAVLDTNQKNSKKKDVPYDEGLIFSDFLID